MKQKPAFIINIISPPGTYDVNMSPDKREIALLNESSILERLREGIDHLYQSSRYTFITNSDIKSTQTKITFEHTEIKTPSDQNVTERVTETEVEDVFSQNSSVLSPVETPVVFRSKENFDQILSKKIENADKKYEIIDSDNKSVIKLNDTKNQCESKKRKRADINTESSKEKIVWDINPNEILTTLRKEKLKKTRNDIVKDFKTVSESLTREGEDAIRILSKKVMMRKVILISSYFLCRRISPTCALLVSLI
jgi:DNA mismatch repair ATPase MutL